MIAFSYIAATQNCYVRLGLDDASGYTPTASQLAELEAAACRLIDSLPTEFQDDFKVYDFGFYLHNETRQGGYPEAFQWAVDTVQTLSKYYLLFGKQTDQSGVYTRFWVDLKLPETGDFSCIDLISPHFREHIPDKFKALTNVEYAKKSNQYFWYPKTESVVMDSLRVFITAQVACCDPGAQNRSAQCGGCLMSEEQLISLLDEAGFQVHECKVLLNLNAPNGQVNRLIEYAGDKVNVDEDVNTYLQYYQCMYPTRSTKAVGLHFPEDCVDLSAKIDQAKDDTFDLMILYGVFEPAAPQASDRVFCMLLDKNPGIPPNGGGKLFIFNEYGEFVKEAIGSNYHGIFFANVSAISCWENWKHSLPFNINPQGPVNPTTPDELAQFAEFYLEEGILNQLRNYQLRTAETDYEYGGLLYLTNNRSLSVDECMVKPGGCYYTASGISLNSNGGILQHFNIQGLRELEHYNFQGKEYVSVWHSHPDRDGSHWPSGINSPGNGDVDIFYIQSAVHSWGGPSLSEREGVHGYRLPGRVGIILSPLGISIYQFEGYSFAKTSGYNSYGHPKSCKIPVCDCCFEKENVIPYSTNKFWWIDWELKNFHLEVDD